MREKSAPISIFHKAKESWGLLTESQTRVMESTDRTRVHIFRVRNRDGGCARSESSLCLYCFALEVSSENRAAFLEEPVLQTEPTPSLKALLPSARQPKPGAAGTEGSWTDDVLHF